MRYIDHHEAGELLAQKVAALRPLRPIVLAIPPAGVRIGWEIASRLKVPMDVITVREITIPGRLGCAVGAAVDGQFIADLAGCQRQGVSQEYAKILASPEEAAEARREYWLRERRPPVELKGRTVILVSDAPLDLTALRAVDCALRNRGAIGIIYAVPFAPLPHTVGAQPSIQLVSLFQPEDGCTTMLVNAGYQQTTEDEIVELIARSRLLPLIRGPIDGVLHPASTLTPEAEVEVKAC